jgi:hypothetical protein
MRGRRDPIPVQYVSAEMQITKAMENHEVNHELLFVIVVPA